MDYRVSRIMSCRVRCWLLLLRVVRDLRRGRGLRCIGMCICFELVAEAEDGVALPPRDIERLQEAVRQVTPAAVKGANVRGEGIRVVRAE